MTIILRDYQADMIERARQALRRAKRVLLQAPTGAGKTVLASFMIKQTAARGGSAWFICHRAELVEGTSKTFHKFRMPHGYIAAGYPMSLHQMIQVCSIDTLKGRLTNLVAPRLAVIDEAHHGGAAGWAMVMEWLHSHGTIIVGLSATPQRLDGKGLDAHFDEMVPGPQTAWLIERGNLSPYRLYAPHAPDMKGVRKQMGDFAKGDAAEKMDKPKLTGDAIAHWHKYAVGLRTVVFGITVAHSQHIAEQFSAAGIRAAHLDGGTNKGERKRVIQEFASGRIQVLTNVDLFSEGFDMASIAQMDVTIDAVMQMRPTQSLALHLQQVGRALRPGEGKTAIILDHAGNSSRHGFPDDERIWGLKGREKGSRKADNDNEVPPPITCDGCFQQIRRPAPQCCPSCGKRLVADAKEITVADGELVEMTDVEKQRVRAKLKQEQAEAKTLDELVALGRRRGHKNPTGWAQHVYAGRRRNAA
ncbi:putative DNA helicase [Ralstonia phage phiRSP]|uniref:Putative DNA helicase n=1 Tax=Ralstonia phage phiRSP TaxID=2201420 RepID=A0A345ANS1_9CAUD|nr:putative DNA helicase [Ralstonia phage phiRSP]AXF38210.1 putative DNA helicase [Ralstonia phage phiRSP]